MSFSTVAIIAARNEVDIIRQVVGDLIDQGVGVYFMDDGSTDGTVEEVAPYLGRGVLRIERLSDTFEGVTSERFEWERILSRKAQLARELDADWFIHHDADEFRESPWPHLSLNEAIRRVDQAGFNAIDSAVLNFWPVHDRFRAGDDVRQAFPFYAPPAPYDRLQIRCWKKTGELVDLASSGGHDARFAGRRVFPTRFILRHYPIRGQTHGECKILERKARFLETERARGWHVQYNGVRDDGVFIRDSATLTPYDADAVRVALAASPRGLEELEAAAGDLRRALEARKWEIEFGAQELARARADVGALTAEAAGLRDQIAKQARDIQRLERGLKSRGAEIEALRAEGVRRIDELHRSLSWRLTAPARAAYRVLTGKGRGQ